MHQKVNSKEMEGVFKATPQKRYSYFIKNVADWQNVWGLRNKDGWALTEDMEGNTYIPFWPAKEYAELFATGEWSDCKADAIEVHEFINEFMDDLEKDNIRLSIFKIPNGESIMVSHYDLKNHIQYELNKIEGTDT